ANKTARIIWALLDKGEIYRRPDPLAIAAGTNSPPKRSDRRRPCAGEVQQQALITWDEIPKRLRLLPPMRSSA
ncbi:hypothetical protein, partial [Bradyrhizobium genomosp. III]|uniref:hypothetical protein n=1 Tax=Bradyrhizobium genomosp. III TaxID=2683271 RepID=UPI001AEBF8DA